MWLSALSFLSHSTRAMDNLASPPPLIKQEDQHLLSQEHITGFGRTSTQNSIGVVKVKGRPSTGAPSYSSTIGSIEQGFLEGATLPWHDEEAASDDAAEPPQVHRVNARARKCSSTGPSPVPLSAFQNYPSNAMAMGSSSSLQGPTSRERYDRYTPYPPASGNTSQGTLTRHLIESSIAPSPVVPENFFESAGTVRMEAFVDRKEEEFVLTTRSQSYRSRDVCKKYLGFLCFYL